MHVIIYVCAVHCQHQRYQLWANCPIAHKLGRTFKSITFECQIYFSNFRRPFRMDSTCDTRYRVNANYEGMTSWVGASKLYFCFVKIFGKKMNNCGVEHLRKMLYLWIEYQRFRYGPKCFGKLGQYHSQWSPGPRCFTSPNPKCRILHT